jgi:hypothetical protein
MGQIVGELSQTTLSPANLMSRPLSESNRQGSFFGGQKQDFDFEEISAILLSTAFEFPRECPNLSHRL